MAEVVKILELIAFLISGSRGGMVPHQRGKYAKRQPAQQQISRGVRSEAAQVRSGIQKSAHVQRRQHFQVQQDVGPPGLVVAHPDSAVAVHSNIGGTGEHEETFRRVNSFKRLARSAGHIVPKQVVHLVVANPLPVHRMIKTAVILLAVCQPSDLSHQRPDGSAGDFIFRAVVGIRCRSNSQCPRVDPAVMIFIFQKCFEHPFQLFDALRGVEDRRLIHIIPEALNPLIY